MNNEGVKERGRERYSSKIIIIKDFIVGLGWFDARETTNTCNSPTLRILKKKRNNLKKHNSKKSSDTSLARKCECDGAHAEARP